MGTHTLEVVPETKLEPIFVTIKTGCRLTGLGPTKLYELLGSGVIDSVKIDGRRLLKYDSIKRLGAQAAA